MATQMALESSWELLKTKCKGPALKYPALACPAPDVKEPQCSWPGSADLNWGVGTTQLEPHLPEWWLMASLQSPVPSCAIRSHFPVGRKGASLGLQTRFLHQNSACCGCQCFRVSKVAPRGRSEPKSKRANCTSPCGAVTLSL